MTEHGQFVREKVMRNVTPGTSPYQVITPQSWHSPDIDPSQRLETLVLRGMHHDEPASNPPSAFCKLEGDEADHELIPRRET